MKPILFLDIDGVMAVFYDNKTINYKNSMMCLFKDTCVTSLNYIIEKTNCDIVISSDWRHHYNLSELCEIFKINKISKMPIDVTCLVKGSLQDLEKCRIEEIKIWLKDKSIDLWCAIDDMDLGGLGNEHFVRCVRPGREGLGQCGIKEKVIKKLTYENKN